jgi:hypothetical protein
MFDIKDYFCDSCSDFGCVNIFDGGNADDDVVYDIENLLKNRFSRMYNRDRFKKGSSGIELIYPGIIYPGAKSLMINPDYVRFLLSLYPYKSDFENIDKIVIKPRHIEIGDTELVSLYLRKSRILVIYLYHPHFYSMTNSKVSEYAEFMPVNLMEFAVGKINNAKFVKTANQDIKIPPLWYLLSVITCSNDNLIDKFLLKMSDRSDRKIQRSLDEISFYYSQHGY